MGDGAAPGLVIGVDVGGTFTDLVAIDPAVGTCQVVKVLSTPNDPSAGVLDALRQVQPGLDRLDLFVHGTTLATNALIEGRGAVCGLLTTRGFRDVLELRRRDRARMFGLYSEFRPLVPRWLRLEIDERTDASGAILREVDDGEVVEQARRLLGQGAEAVSIAFLHAYANPSNERRAEQAVRSVWPNEFVSVSSDILPEFREFERTTATVANNMLEPLMARYLGSLEARLQTARIPRLPLIVQGNGSMMAASTAARRPIDTILSGPAAGVVAARAIGRQCGFENVISCDMGGTSFDVCLVRSGRPAMAAQRTPIFGLPLRIPALDIVTIGAGGGSIAWLDAGGMLQVGPRSAGAVPGPACYGRGGRSPTVTDANLWLGRLGRTRLQSGTGTLALNRDHAGAALAETIGRGLSLGTDESALAVLEIATNSMANAIRSVSVERGHDPREFALIVFGGAGPLHAAALMRHLEVPRAIVPRFPGLTSAAGCVLADLQHDFVQTMNVLLDDVDLQCARRVVADHQASGQTLLGQAGTALAAVDTLVRMDASYDGQTHTIEVDIPDGLADAAALRQLFERAYMGEYGHLADNAPIRLVNLRTSVIGRRSGAGADLLRTSALDGRGEHLSPTTDVWFDRGWCSCPVYTREALDPGAALDGPALVIQSDTTIVVEPGIRATPVEGGNLLLELR